MMTFPIRFLLVFFIVFLSSPANGAKKKNILFLNSYQNGYIWSDSIINGIRSVTGNAPYAIDLDVEYMDSKKHYDAQIETILFKYYRYKYKDTGFDAVIASDNTAFRFMLHHREKLFPGVPLIFCGVNDFSGIVIENRQNITGVSEYLQFGENLKIALSLQPETRVMIVVGDESVTCRAIVRQIKNSIKRDKIDFDIRFMTGFKSVELIEKLKGAPEGSVIFFLPFYEKQNNDFLSSREIMIMIYKNTGLPIYSSWDFFLGAGLVGGKLASGYRHGKIAAKMALRILAGEKTADIPVVKKVDDPLIFDYNVLKRFGINEKQLPGQSEIINTPYHFYEMDRRVFWSLVLVFFLLSGILFVLVMNILKRKKAEIALRESGERLRLILDNIPQLVFWQDYDLRFVDVNKSFLSFFNLKNAGDIIGKNDYNLLGIGENARKALRTNRSVINTKKPLYRIKWKLKKAGREPIWLELNKIPMHDNNEGTIGILTTAEDITRKMSLENQLLQARKMEALGIFSSGIAHDFNNILTSIINSTELAMEDIPKESMAGKDLERVLIVGSRGSNLVNQILTFSSPTHHEFHPVDVKLVAEEALDIIKTTLPANIHMVKNIIQKPVFCMGDSTRIHQIIMNLCANSFQAMADKGGEFEIRLGESVVDKAKADLFNIREGYYIEIIVADTGPGIAPDLIDKIFDPFFTTKRKNRGTGLGLSVVHGIIKAHKGGIHITSKPFQRTEFKVYLPQLKEDGKIESDSPFSPLTGDEKILFVEDNEDQRESVPRGLRGLGYSVTAVAGAEDALDVFQRNPGFYDLVISDYDMPVSDGTALARKLAELSPGLPVILVSGRKIDSRVADSLNIKKIILKPYNKRILSNAIRQVMDGEG